MMALALAALLAPGALPAGPPPVAIVGATLIDGTGAPSLPGSAVIVRDGRIAAVGRQGAVAVPSDAQIVDARGRWLIPGLIDAHVHLDEVLAPSGFVLYGVTSVRDCGSRLVTLQRLRARAAHGEPLPRLLWLGRNIDEGKPSWWNAVAVKGPREVPALLAGMARQGVDGAKLYVRARPDVARAVIRESHRRGWPVTGHLEDTTPSDAARSGIDQIEHVFTLFEELTPRGAKGPPGFGKAFAGVPDVDLRGPRARALIRLLARRRVAVTPTLTVSIMPVEGERAADRVYSGWAEVPPGWRAFWKSPYWGFLAPARWTRRDYRTARLAAQRYRQMVRALYRAGVPIVAGTDTPAPWVLPGAGLVHELELLRECGLPPMEVLRSATGRAAGVMRRSGQIGTVRPGRFADLVLLDADPLADIHALRRVHAVYLAGRQVDLRAAADTVRNAKPGEARPQE